MSSEIPILDFGQFSNGSVEKRRHIAQELDDALKSIGFFHLINHGIDAAKVEKAFEWSKRLFNLSETQKASFAASPGRGYLGFGKEIVRGKASAKESYHILDLEHISPGRRWPNVEWLSEFRDFAAEFHEDCSMLIAKLLDCTALALSLNPDESLRQYHTGSLYSWDLIHYPSVPNEKFDNGEVVRNAAHSDFGTFTLLFQHGVGGLEIADMGSTVESATAAVEKTAKFIHVDPKPGAIAVNVGYLLMRWTNGRWKNSVHRVSKPPPTSGQHSDELAPERYSIAFFSFPDAKATIEPLSTCCHEVDKKWGPINAGAYLEKKRAYVPP